MKKLMVAAAIVCAAVASQAAVFNWTTDTTRLWGVNPAEVGDNGPYGINSSKSDYRADKAGLSLGYKLTILSADGLTEIGYKEGTVELGKLGKVATEIDVAEAEQNTDYKYVFELKGAQDTLTSKESETYDYSGAQLAASFEGGIKTAASGQTDILYETTPDSWTISGIVTKETPVPPPVPEPTSGLLLLLGVAGLALRRRRS